ncbi:MULTISPECIES: hypothetical protein [unclassified Brevundimonas]|jgi:hypothetical protein|uniref:hypothetical protein n=1 Tax=unclassified Brevundimonas TaxID=2622653 RepID=UPI000C4A7674|nr:MULTISPECIES: hypothetical protein [unclassified Brevundimonas]MAL87466.1 hypothetical protein [Brevundimonas sp.]HAJ04417.1 hypothetical protein [Brevundimonas sp.]HAV49317.1 hypothetical protein [Brevundimonas sp.]|tara:strand:+ start:245 stop:928 length:684 start_codon:yes stop_codon:yes gene_type:complete
MAIVIIIIIAVVAFVIWSKGAAKSAKMKYLQAHNNAFVERFAGKYSKPSWWDWKDKAMTARVKDIVRPLVSKSGFSPVAVALWLDGDETWEDLLTFMAHAERAGFKQVEQIALLPDFALSALNVDLFNEKNLTDKNILLYLIAATKQRNQQNNVDVTDIPYKLVEEYIVSRGGAMDEEVREFYPCFNYEFDYRSVMRSVAFVEGCSPTSITVYDNAPDPYRSFHPSY